MFKVFFKKQVLICLQILILGLSVLAPLGGSVSALPNPQLTGTVKDTSGGTIASATVSAVDNTNASNTATTTSDASGNYTLTLSPAVYNITYTASSSYNPLIEENVSVQVDTTLNVAVNASSTSAHTFTGRVTETGGSPIVGIGVMVLNNSGVQVASNSTDTNGYFAMSVASNMYYNVKLQGLSAGYAKINGIDMVYPDFGSWGDVNLDLTNTDVNLNLVMSFTKLSITATDASGNPAANAAFSYQYRNNVFGYAAVSSANQNYAFAVNSISIPFDRPTTDSNGQLTMLVPTNGVFSNSTSYVQPFCVTFASGNKSCDSCTVNTAHDVTLNFHENAANVTAPDVPQNLIGDTMTTTVPSLSWNSTCGASSYNIYRNGTKIGTVTSPSTLSYTDTSAPEGTLNYAVTASNSVGEGSASAPLQVVYDATAPTVTASVGPVPNVNGWNNTGVTVSFSCADAVSGVQSTTSPISYNAEGANQQVTGNCTDNASNVGSATATLNIDETKPTVSTPTTSTILLMTGSSATIGATVADTLSGVTTGEYYIDTDPGAGNGTPMTLASGKISATIPASGMTTGVHLVYMRSKDAAGNWSTTTSTLITRLL